MNILHIIATVDPRWGGPVEGVFQQARVRVRETVTTHIVCLDRSDDPWVTESPVKTFALGLQGSLYQKMKASIPWLRYGYTPRLVPWLRQHAREYDIIVVNGLWNYASLAARRALISSGVPYVVFTHGMLDPWFRKHYPVKHLLKQVFWLFSEGPLLSNARAVMFTTEDEKLLAQNMFWPYDIEEEVVGYGTADVGGDIENQIAAFRHALPELGNQKFLLFLSRIHPKKGCDILIEAFARIANRYPDLHLVVAGPDQIGWADELRARSEEIGLGKRIHWPGMLSGDAKWGAFRACEAFLLPSHSENFGIVVAEAMACLKPVIITNKVNIWRDVVEFGGGIVSNDQLDDFASALAGYMALSDQEKTEMGKRARNCFQSQYNIAQVIKKQLDLFRRIIATRC